MISVIFCRSGSVAQIIPSVTNLALQEAFENVAQINKELKGTEFDGVFCKKFRLLIDRFSFFSLNVENQ